MMLQYKYLHHLEFKLTQLNDGANITEAKTA